MSTSPNPATVILDVRTPAEYAVGHLEGARLLDFNGGEFFEAIPGLDRVPEYLLYCRSGARSAAAAEILEVAGFHTANLGSLEEAAVRTGINIVS